MNTIKSIWPLSAACTDMDTLVKNIVIYVVAMVILSLIGGLIGALLGIIGKVIGVVFWAADLYCFVGIVLSVLIYFNIIK